MKKMFMFLVLMVVATIGQSVFAQNSINLVERQIKAASADVDRSTKKFELEKSRKIAELTREVKHKTAVGLRANTSKGRESAANTLKKLNAQIDSVSKLPTNAEVQTKTKLLANLQQQQKALSEAQLAIQSKPTLIKDSTPGSVKESKKTVVDPYDRSIPTRLTKLDRNQRSRSHSTRLDELVIAKVEQNINAILVPAGQTGGYKVVFDNMYTQTVDFKVVSINGIIREPIVLDPGTKQVEYLLPGKYRVEFYVNGHMSGQPRTLTIDGQTCSYKGIDCFGYVYMPKFN